MRVASTLSWMVGDAAGQQIALEVRRDVEREGVEPGIHAPVHLLL
jgi:hypothetical protein